MTAVLTQAASGGSAQIVTIVLYMAAFGALIYFMMFRPQKKEQARRDAMLSNLEVGAAVLTSSGFYGVVIDIPDEDTVIVEFGSNKNCRIPMKKSAIQEVEKPGTE